MMCVESVKNKTTKELLPDEINIGKRISNAAEDMGLLIRPIGHLNVMSPPLTLSREDVDFLVKTLSAAIKQVTGELKVEGHL